MSSAHWVMWLALCVLAMALLERAWPRSPLLGRYEHPSDLPDVVALLAALAAGVVVLVGTWVRWQR